MTEINLNHNHSYYQQIQNIICCNYLKEEIKMMKTLLNLRRLTSLKVTAKICKNW